MEPVDVPYLDSEAIEQSAIAFLRKYWPNGKIPVRIDYIAESKLGVDLVYVPGLRQAIESDEFAADAYILSDLSAIHIDGYAWDNIPNRYRFSIAHELGHLTLHRDILATYRANSNR